MTALGRYQIVGPLASGSTSVIQRARDTLQDREVALKTPRPGAAVSDSIRQRFLREARIGSRLRHPGIVTILDFGEAEGIPYIAMELLEGEDLGQCIDRKRRIPLPLALDLFAQAAHAIAYVHTNQVIHRNLHPRSLFVHKERQAKILDFGLAHLESSHLTVAGRVVGTPNYMAPEQIQGKPCDARSDLFSLAIVFFELIAGVHPFQSSFIPRRIAEEDPDPLLSVDPSLPRHLDALFRRALAKPAESRFQTGEQLAAAIRGDLATAASAPESTTDVALAQFLSLAAAFDESFERTDLPAARQVVLKMRGLSESDTRFADAIAGYQERLDKETASMAPAIDAARLAAMSLEKTTILRAPPELVEEPTVPKAVPAEVRPAPGRSSGRWKMLAAAAGFAAIASLGWWTWFRPARSLGSAVLSSPARISVEPAESGASGGLMAAGTRVDILATPERGWVRVQPHDGPGGYIRTADLADWSTLDLLRAARPADAADEGARKHYVESLLRYLVVHHGGVEARAVRLEIVNQHVLGMRATNWQSAGACESYADRARQLLQAAGGDTKLEQDIALAKLRCALAPQ